MIRKKKEAARRPPQKLPRLRSAKSVGSEVSNLGAELQTRRVKLGLTQKAMSEICQLQVATIAKIEKGDPGVRLGTLQAYLDALNLMLTVQEKELE
jgi:predicted transcriptional regulator